jgi:signal transduction histidine kinase
MHLKMTILKKGLILLAIPMIFQVAFLFVAFRSQADLIESQRWAMHTKDVIGKAESIYRRLIEGQGALRGLVLSGNLAKYEPVERSVREVPQSLEELKALVVDNSPQRAKVVAMEGQIAALLSRQFTTAQLYREGNQAEALARVKETMTLGMVDGLRATIDNFLSTEERLDAVRLLALDRSTRRQRMALLGGGGATLIATVVLLVGFSRGFTQRFSILRENVRRLAEGTKLSSPITGRDEVADLDRAFHLMAKALDEKDRENELFIYSVSHDLRSPLVNLEGFSQELGYAREELRTILRDESVPERLRSRGLDILDRDVSDAIRFIRTAVSRLSVIIDALLRLSRAGRVEYRLKQVDVDMTVGRVIEALGSSIAEKQAGVTTTPLPPAWADPTAVEQIFANLVGNAINYLDPNRPGVIEVGAKATEMLSNGTGQTTYYVRDNGLGIPESGLPKLFLAFQRFHGGTKGEGIGLALVRKIVERHGGAIRVESTFGVGSTFFVDLPSGPPLIESAQRPFTSEFAKTEKIAL